MLNTVAYTIALPVTFYDSLPLACGGLPAILTIFSMDSNMSYERKSNENV